MPPKAKPAHDARPQQEDEQVDTTSTRLTVGDGASGSGGAAEGAVLELASMMKTLLKAQEARANQWEKVVQSQDQRWKTMNHQFQLLQGQVGDIQGRESSTANTPQPLAATGDSRETMFKDPKLHPLSKEDDIEHFPARLAEVFQSARLGTRGPSTSQWSSARSKSDGGDEKHGQAQGRPTSYNRGPDSTRQDFNCYHCGKPGHSRRNCQERKTHDLAIHQDHIHNIHLTAQVT